MNAEKLISRSAVAATLALGLAYGLSSRADAAPCATQGFCPEAPNLPALVQTEHYLQCGDLVMDNGRNRLIFPDHTFFVQKELDGLTGEALNYRVVDMGRVAGQCGNPEAPISVRTYTQMGGTIGTENFRSDQTVVVTEEILASGEVRYTKELYDPRPSQLINCPPGYNPLLVQNGFLCVINDRGLTGPVTELPRSSR